MTPTKTEKHIDIKAFFEKHTAVFISLLLAVITFAVFSRVGEHEFINYDDPTYVIENHYIQNGLTFESIGWALTTTYGGNWHPITWISHMLDVKLYGLNPSGHHLTGLLFHIANTVLVFFLFRKMTLDAWRAGFVALLFAVHPVHVESVAWVSERKDVLSTFFWMLTMLCYIRHVEHPALIRYLGVVIFFVLGLMAKPMLVTLPFVLLLIDYWPLGRIRFAFSGNNETFQAKPQMFRIIWEKIPLFVLAALSSVVTFLAEKHGGAVISLDVIPFKTRISNALISYIKYIGKMIFPAKLAVYYPFPEMFLWWQVAGACLLLVFITVFSIRTIKSSPYLAVGWLWYLGTLVPVIGLVQIGSQSMADRYTYIPFIGLFIIAAWGLPELCGGMRKRKIVLAALSIIWFSILIPTTWNQLGHWKNSAALFEHALQATNGNYLAHEALADALLEQNQLDKAVEHYEESIRIHPENENVQYNLGVTLKKQGRINEAIEHYEKSLQINPENEKALYNLGIILEKQGRINDAIEHYLKSLKINPENESVHYSLGLALEQQGHIKEAVEHYLKTVQINPNNENAHYNLGIALKKQGRINDAIEHYLKSLKINPNNEKAHNNLAIIYEKQGQNKEALEHYLEALRVNPNHFRAHNNLGNLLLRLDRVDEAIRHYSEALHIRPEFEGAHNNLGIALMRKGNVAAAIEHFREALRLKPDDADAQRNLEKALEYRRQNSG